MNFTRRKKRKKMKSCYVPCSRPISSVVTKLTKTKYRRNRQKKAEGKKILPPPLINIFTEKTEQTYNDNAKTLNKMNVQSKVVLGRSNL